MRAFLCSFQGYHTQKQQKLKPKPKQLIELGSLCNMSKESEKKGDVFLPWKAVVAMILSGLVIGVVSKPDAINEAWAWEVAKALITINGLLIGFSILGITVFVRRSYTQTILRESCEEIANDIARHLLQSGKKLDELTLEELSSLTGTLFEIPALSFAFQLSIAFFLVSIGLALCLFGVTPERAENPIVADMFSLVYGFAIANFLNGVYGTMYGINQILKKTKKVMLRRGLNLISSLLKKKLKKLEKEQAKKKK